MQRPEFENSFNFDNVTIADDDSDGEEFVNIVVQEIERQIGKDDENVKKILRKVSQSTRRGESGIRYSFYFSSKVSFQACFS